MLQLVYSFYSLSLKYIYKIIDGRTAAAKILAPVAIQWANLKGDPSVENWACLLWSTCVSDLGLLSSPLNWDCKNAAAVIIVIIYYYYYCHKKFQSLLFWLTKCRKYNGRLYRSCLLPSSEYASNTIPSPKSVLKKYRAKCEMSLQPPCG